MVAHEWGRYSHRSAASRAQRPAYGRTIPHLSPAFLATAVTRLDAVFGDLTGGVNNDTLSTPKALLTIN